MPIIEYKNIERLHPEDMLLDDAGYLLKAGMAIGERAPELAKHKAAVYRVIALSQEEKEKTILHQEQTTALQAFIAKRQTSRLHSLRERLRETLLSFYPVYDENQQIFSIPGSRRKPEKGILLEHKLNPLYKREIEAGANRIINKYKYTFMLDILKEIYDNADKFKPREPGAAAMANMLPRFNFFSIRLNSLYDGGRFSLLGDAHVNQAVDIALGFIFTMLNINKQRILSEAPLSENRFDPTKKTTSDTRYQYRSGMILDAAAGILLHNIGYSHSAIHELVSAKPLLTTDDETSRKKMKMIVRNINAARHLTEALDISSISGMMVAMQRDYPDGTGFPYLNSNRNKHEFLRLFQIIKFYDELVNPVNSPTPYSRHDVLEYLQAQSGSYSHNPDSFTPVKRFDSELLREFLNMIMPWEPGEKVYLYSPEDSSRPVLIGKVKNYTNSWLPILSILRDEKRNKVYRDGQILISIPDSCMYIRQAQKYSKKVMPWIGMLRLFDKGIDPGDIHGYQDLLFGQLRKVARGQS